MITIIESSMTFGPFPETKVYQIEKSNAYEEIKDGVKVVEFIYTRSPEKLLFVEAKSSSPRPGGEEFDTYIKEITEKFTYSFNLWMTLKLGRRKDDVPIEIIDGDAEKQKYRFILVINGHETEWLPPVKAALERRMKAEIKIWDHEIIVLNEVRAKKWGLIKSWEIRRMNNSVKKYAELFNSEGQSKGSTIINLFLVSLFSSDTLLSVEDCEQSEIELLKIKNAISNSKLSDELKEYWTDKVDRGLRICLRDKEVLQHEMTKDDTDGSS